MRRTALSEKEFQRASVFARVQQGELSIREASEVVRLSYRQTRRLYQRFLTGGKAGLVHRSVGRPSPRSYDPSYRRRVLELVEAHYGGASERRAGQRLGPTLAAERLERDHGLLVDAETLRRWMLQAGLWSRQRSRSAHRERRERKAHFGELVQLDGSFHDWFEGRAPVACLMTMIDDATGTVLSRFSDEETTWDAARLLRGWLERYGIPRQLYTDWKNVYIRKQTDRERLLGLPAVTAFGAMCERLDITIIGASSPQAKGRVERSHGTDQDRLVKELRLASISGVEEGNRYLAEEYLALRNARFAVRPSSVVDYHRSLAPTLDLSRVFTRESERVVSGDWVVQYEGRLLYVRPRHDVPRKARVVVSESEEGALRVLYRGRSGGLAGEREIELIWDEEPPADRSTKPSAKATSRSPKPSSKPSSGRSSKPAADHPFRRAFPVSARAVALCREWAAASAREASAPESQAQ